MRLLIVIFLSVFAQIQSAHALVEVPTFRFAIGHSMLKFSAIDRNGLTTIPEGTSLGAPMTIDPSFLWDIPMIRSRAGLHFLADIGSPYGFVTTIGVGLDFVFYPMGLSSSREVKDDGSLVIKTRISPFIEMKVTPEKFSITLPSASTTSATAGRDYFNILMVETSIGAGLDYPMGESYSLFGGLHYRFASFTSQEAEIGKVSYSGLALLVGIQTNFY